MNRIEQLKNELNINTELQKFLFIRGFLVTNNKNIETATFPFYGNWDETEYGEFSFLTHKNTGKCFYYLENKMFFILGHAYNPFTMEYEEEKILKKIASNYEDDKFIDDINELTGVFVVGVCEENSIRFLVDPSGLQSACFGHVDDRFYLTSHTQIVGDICGLEMDEFVEKLIRYKWYKRVMGCYLPADLTPFKEIKRIVPSIDYKVCDMKVNHRRIWLKDDIKIAVEESAYNEVINKAATIMKNNMELISKKWEKPAISLTGGIDSNTTFAAANGRYDKFQAFSYLSAEKEIPDVEAAKKIAKAFDVKFNLYEIPKTSETLESYEVKYHILMHNNAYVAETPENEIRKRIVLEKECDIDVEVKSWGSETIRAYWYKHYGRSSMPKLSAKLFRNLYKIFLFNRVLAKKIDKLFDEYIKTYEYDKVSNTYDIADIHYNEVTWGSWGGLNISEMKYCFDITIPYNNRIFYNELFKVPLEKRISDQHHLDMKCCLNKKFWDMKIRVINMKETDFRANMLNIVFTINSFLPF